MDGWLKGLVAVACAAVIAATGAYFWDRQNTQTAATEAAGTRANCAKSVSSIFDPKLGYSDFTDSQLAAEIRTCRDQGLIAANDLEAVRKSRIGPLL